MFTKEITYTDYNGNERKEKFYFNLSKAELIELELSIDGGYAKKIKQTVKEENVQETLAIFKMIISKSYGEKSEDGRRFIKSKELSDAFMQTEAYSELFVELSTNPDAAQQFLDNVCPALSDADKAKAKAELAKLNK